MKQFDNLTIVFSHFPQISRKFNAVLCQGLKLLSIVFAAAMLIGYIFHDLPILKPFLPLGFSDFERAKIVVTFTPNDLSSHLLLAQEYLKRGNIESVEREFLLAQQLTNQQPETSSRSVLGAALSPIKILEKIKNEPQRIKNEISFWEKVVAEKPDYRDAYLQLAILNYQIYKNDKAQEYLKKAKELDPNFEATKEIEKTLGY